MKCWKLLVLISLRLFSTRIHLCSTMWVVWSFTCVWLLFSCKAAFSLRYSAKLRGGVNKTLSVIFDLEWLQTKASDMSNCYVTYFTEIFLPLTWESWRCCMRCMLYSVGHSPWAYWKVLHTSYMLCNHETWESSVLAFPFHCML